MAAARGAAGHGGGREEFQDEFAIPEVLRDFLVLIRTKLERLYEQAPPLVGELERLEAEQTTLNLLYRGIEAQRGRWTLIRSAS